MLRQNINLFRRVNFLLDITFSAAALYLSYIGYWLLQDSTLHFVDVGKSGYQYLALVVVIWSSLIHLRGERYKYRLKQTGDIVGEVLRLVFYGTIALLASSYIFHLPPLPRSQFAIFIAVDFAALFLLRIALLKILHHLRSLGYNVQTTIIVGTRERVKRLVDDISLNKRWGMKVAGIVGIGEFPSLYRFRDIPLMGTTTDLPELIKRNHVDYVVISLPEDKLVEARSIINVCHEAGVNVCLRTDFFEQASMQYTTAEFAGRPSLLYAHHVEPRKGAAVKGIVDRIAAIVGLILLTPPALLVATLIKLTSRGPVFFKQLRCGLNGRQFFLYKFRTMCEDAEQLKESLRSLNEMDGSAFKIKNDPRITPLGKALRKLSLDELPQLINVAKGEMSLVGPRPPLPDEVKEYNLWQRRKLSMRPGLTCLWQVGDRNDTNFEQWMKLDLEYIDNWSLWLDARILARTIPAVLNATGR